MLYFEQHGAGRAGTLANGGPKTVVFASGHRSPTSRSAKIGGMKEGEWCLTSVSSRMKLL